MGCIGHDFETTAIKMDRFVPRDDRKTAHHSSASWRAQRGHLFSVIASAARQSVDRFAPRDDLLIVTTRTAAAQQSDGQAPRYNVDIAELSELLAGRFIKPAKAFARLRVNRVGNADKPL
jgi:hypothetical protein